MGNIERLTMYVWQEINFLYDQGKCMKKLCEMTIALLKRDVVLRPQ